MKNFKLLLATTAILSTGLAIGALAEDEYDGPATGTATLKAEASFTSPIRAGANPIYFGTLDPVIGGDVTVSANSNDSATGDGIILKGNNSGWLPHRGSITLYGGQVSFDIDYGNVAEGDTGYVLFDDLEHKVITLKETESYNSDTKSPGSGQTCGTVTNFTEGAYEIDSTSYGTRTVSSLSIPVGATLSIQDGYQPSGNHTLCEGSTTITYILTTNTF